MLRVTFNRKERLREYLVNGGNSLPCLYPEENTAWYRGT